MNHFSNFPSSVCLHLPEATDDSSINIKSGDSDQLVFVLLDVLNFICANLSWSSITDAQDAKCMLSPLVGSTGRLLDWLESLWKEAVHSLDVSSG